VNALAERGYRRIEPTDTTGHQTLFEHLRQIPVFWHDGVLAHPEAWYVRTFCHPLSLVYDIADGGGMIAFTNVIPKWRCVTYGAAWDRTAMRRATEDWHYLGYSTLQVYDLFHIDAFTNVSNLLMQRLLDAIPLTRQAVLPKYLWYNGVPEDVIWYQADRDTTPSWAAQQGE